MGRGSLVIPYTQPAAKSPDVPSARTWTTDKEVSRCFSWLGFAVTRAGLWSVLHVLQRHAAHSSFLGRHSEAGAVTAGFYDRRLVT